MASKTRRGGKSRAVKKNISPHNIQSSKVKNSTSTETQKSVLPQKITEKDAGFGIIKVVVGVFVALILGATFLNNFSGASSKSRGDSGQDIHCDSSGDCKSGFVCQAFGNQNKRCLELCSSSSKCDNGHTCTSVAKPGRGKNLKIRKLCVPNAEAKQ